MRGVYVCSATKRVGREEGAASLVATKLLLPPVWCVSCYGFLGLASPCCRCASPSVKRGEVAAGGVDDGDGGVDGGLSPLSMLLLLLGGKS